MIKELKMESFNIIIFYFRTKYNIYVLHQCNTCPVYLYYMQRAGTVVSHKLLNILFTSKFR